MPAESVLCRRPRGRFAFDLLGAGGEQEEIDSFRPREGRSLGPRSTLEQDFVTLIPIRKCNKMLRNANKWVSP